MTPLAWLVLAGLAVYLTVGAAVFSNAAWSTHGRVARTWLWAPLVLGAVAHGAIDYFRSVLTKVARRHGRWEIVKPAWWAGERHLVTLGLRWLVWSTSRVVLRREYHNGFPAITLRDREGIRGDVTIPGIPACRLPLRDLTDGRFTIKHQEDQ